MDAPRTGAIRAKTLTPEALAAVISLSPASRPNAVRTATITAMGTAITVIQARLRTKPSSTARPGTPLAMKRFR